MNKLNISVSTLSLRFIGPLFLLIICISAMKVESLPSYQDDNNDGELKNILTSDDLYLIKDMNNRADHPIIRPDYDIQYDQIRIIPYKKRTIPIELQKALYAHGIVGR